MLRDDAVGAPREADEKHLKDEAWKKKQEEAAEEVKKVIGASSSSSGATTSSGVAAAADPSTPRPKKRLRKTISECSVPEELRG